MNAVTNRIPTGVLAIVVLASTVLALTAVPAHAATTTWTVTSTDDTDGPCGTTCTLRSAIKAANASAGGDAIVFNILPSGRATISVGAGARNNLPALTGDDISIDGSTQPGGGAPGVRIDDPDNGGGESGIVLEGMRETIRGLIITRFDAYGILVRNGSSNNVIAGNWVGTHDGVTDLGTRDDGIHISGGGNNLIGGTTAADRNLIDGSGNDGIELESSSDNVIIGNYVAMTADGLSRIPNADSGIEINGRSFRNHIGGQTAAERNVVSGNEGIGVQLLGSLQPDGSCNAPEDNVIEGNYLGVNVDGAKPGSYGNRGEGAQMSVCAHRNTIGGTATGARNIISGNHADGIELDSSGGPGGTLSVCDNTIQGNYIGADPTGKIAVPNVDDGIGLDNGACNNLIGGTTPGAGNLISGSYNDGIDISRAGSNGNTIQNNVIGLSGDGSTVLRNGQNGITLRSKVQRTTVEGNVISANLMSGVFIQGYLTYNNIVRNNKIGTNVAGTSARGNKQYGVWLYDGPQSNTVEDNLILGNTLDGVAVERVPASNYTTRYNKITANRILGNGGLGIDLLPSDGVNTNDGSNANAGVGNQGLDFPVVKQATSVSVKGTAPANAVVEVFSASPGTGESNGEGSVLLGTTRANATGSWCLNGINVSGSVTATSTDASGDTSEFAANVAASGTSDLCGAPPPSNDLFIDDFTAPDGSTPADWEIRRSATGAGAGATIQSNQLRENVALASTQEGTWQYVQAREVPVLPSWSANTVSFAWQMNTNATTTQTVNLVLAPSAATGNVLSLADYLRVRVTNGTLSIVRRVAAGTPATVWSGPVTSSASVRDFRLVIDTTNLSLYEGPVGSAALRVGSLAHGLSWSSAYPYLYSSTNSSTVFGGLFDAVHITKV